MGPALRKYWSLLCNKPLGKWLFSYLVGRLAPYTGTISARVESLSPGHGLVSLKDRKPIRNHLNSIHAIALVNLGELTTGLALMNSLPEGMRGILVHIEMSYHKKARGTLVAECFCNVPAQASIEYEEKVTADIRDREGDVVATAVATWLIGPE